MIEILYLGLGIITFITMNTLYLGWRANQMRKAEIERDRR